MVLRYLFGFTSSYEKLIGRHSPYQENPEAIFGRLEELLPVMDIDDDGTVHALTDGLLLIRYLFGFRGNALIEGAVGLSAARTDADQIKTYIDALSQD